MGQTEPYNLYGVIIDATFPYVKNKCLVSIRIIDDTLNVKCARQLANSSRAISGHSMTQLQLQMFAKGVGDLPHIFRIGDIIRLHRVNLGEY